MTQMNVSGDFLADAIGPDRSTCLLVGDGRFAAPALASILPNFDRIVVHAGDRPFELPTAGREVERLDGALAAISDYPRLGDVVGAAESRADVALLLHRFVASRERAENVSALAPFARSQGVPSLDLVVIGDEPVLAGEIVRQLSGAGAFLIAGVKTTFGGRAAVRILSNAADYQLSASGSESAQDWALFVRRDPRLTVHFFTLIATHEAFIRYHQPIFAALPFEWRWHIVEGRPAEEDDGEEPVSSATRLYLDSLLAADPERITLHRPVGGDRWTDRLQMLNAPLKAVDDACLLWRVDPHELWTTDQIIAIRDAFLAEPKRTAAWFGSHDHVGPGWGIATRIEDDRRRFKGRLRVWRHAPGMEWAQAGRPVLLGNDDGDRYDVGRRRPFLRQETAALGAVMDSFACAAATGLLSAGSHDAADRTAGAWQRWLDAPHRSARLSDYVSRNDCAGAMIDTVERLGWTSAAVANPAGRGWLFRTAGEIAALRHADRSRAASLIVVDGVFFQLSNSGIARLWRNLLAEWVASGFGERVVLLDRGGTAPRIDGVRYRAIERHSWSSVDGDAVYLQRVCDELGATLFVSTYYTTPTHTPVLFMGYDMIPEMLGCDLSDVWWQQKRRAIMHAIGWMTISESAATELTRHYPQIARSDVLIATCSVDAVFTPCADAELAAFRERYSLASDFIMLVGERLGLEQYKNATVVFAALALMPKERRPLLACIGGAAELEGVGKALLDDDDVRLLRLDDEDLRLCYGAALAYVCPSLIEGFGLPILEAMAVGTPALVSGTTAIPEVAGDAGIYFDPLDPASLVAAIERAQNPKDRAAAVIAGFQRVPMFDQRRTAGLIADHCVRIAAALAPGLPDLDGLRDDLAAAEARRQAEALSAAIDDRGERLGSELGAADRALAALSDANADNAAALARTARAAIGRALAELRDLRLPLDQSAAAMAKDDIAVPVSSVGFSRFEGPYPHFGMDRPFRWQTTPISVTSLAVDRVVDVWLEVTFGNVEQGQHITVGVDDCMLCGFHPPLTGWNHVWCIRVPLSLRSGVTKVQIGAHAFNGAMIDGRAMYVAMYGVHLIPRQGGTASKASVVDLSRAVADTPSWAAPVLEVPVRLLESSGLAPLEGPYPHWGIVRPFRWQIAAVSRHPIEAESACSADLQVTFANVEAGQQVTIWHDQTLLHRFTPPSVGWVHQWRIIIPVQLPHGTTLFRVEAATSHAEGDHDGGRRLFIGLYDLLLLFPSTARRGPSVVTDVADEPI